MAIHEECGVFGVIQPEPANVGRVVYYGLYALQHRGLPFFTLCRVITILTSFLPASFLASKAVKAFLKP